MTAVGSETDTLPSNDSVVGPVTDGPSNRRAAACSIIPRPKTNSTAGTNRLPYACAR